MVNGRIKVYKKRNWIAGFRLGSDISSRDQSELCFLKVQALQK